MSKSMYEQQIEHYATKFANTREKLKSLDITQMCREVGIKPESLEKEFNSNSNEFRTLCYNISKTLMPGRVSCTTYAAVVSVIADKLGKPFNVYAGFCLPKSNPRYKAELDAYNENRSTSEGKPLMATHVYLEVNDTGYEFYNGEFNDIDHIDVENITERVGS